MLRVGATPKIGFRQACQSQGRLSHLVTALDARTASQSRF